MQIVRANETDLIPRTWIGIHLRGRVMVGNCRSTTRGARRDRDVVKRVFLVEEQAEALEDGGRHLDARREPEPQRNRSKWFLFRYARRAAPI